MQLMATSNNPSDKPPRRKRTLIGIRDSLAAQAEQLAERLATDLTEIVNAALRERLEREGLWPPPASPSADQ